MKLAEVERNVIEAALSFHNGNRTRAAESLGISVRTIRNKINEYQLARFGQKETPMESSTHNIPVTETRAEKTIAVEFATWPMEAQAVKKTNEVREKFDDLLTVLTFAIPTENARYLALVKTNLETACMFAVKGIAKPV